MNTITKVKNLMKFASSPFEVSKGLYEYQIPGITVRDVSYSVVTQLREWGCKVINVDTSREPYYYVAIQFKNS